MPVTTDVHARNSAQSLSACLTIFQTFWHYIHQLIRKYLSPLHRSMLSPLDGAEVTPQTMLLTLSFSMMPPDSSTAGAALSFMRRQIVVVLDVITWPWKYTVESEFSHCWSYGHFVQLYLAKRLFSGNGRVETGDHPRIYLASVSSQQTLELVRLSPLFTPELFIRCTEPFHSTEPSKTGSRAFQLVAKLMFSSQPSNEVYEMFNI